jgi:outer membrane protein assembly complex protein YaeT
VRALAAVWAAVWAAGCAGEKAEGRPWIRSLHLNGVKNVDAGDLKSRLAMQGRSWWPFWKKPYLNPFDLEIDAKRVQNYYHQHGFFDVRVVEQKVQPVKPDAVDVTLGVEEGRPTRIHAIAVVGLETVNARALRDVKKMHIHVGDLFHYPHYQEEKDRIAGALKQHGYAWAEVEGEVGVDRDEYTAEIKLKVSPGPWARFGRLEVRGTRRVSAKRLEQYANLITGKPFNLEALEDLRGSLYGLGMFSSVRVDYLHAPGRPDIADVVVTVQESTLHEVRFGVGFGIESQRNDVHTSVQYTKRNFLGGLRVLRLRLMPAYVAIPAVWNVQRQGPAGTTDAQLIQPDLFWRTELKFTVGFDVGIDYAYQYYGPRASLSLGRTFWRHHVVTGLAYNFQLYKFFATDPAILEQPDLAGSLYGFIEPYRLAWLQEDALLDLRDRPLDPARGGYFGLSAEEGGVWTGGAFQYQKLMPDVRGYLPLGTRRVVLAGRVEFGQIFVQGDLGSPITRRFYLGGPSSHRGFNYNRLSPQVPSGLQNVEPIPIGGDQMLLAQFELRINLVRLYGNWLAMAAFADGGDVAAPSCGTAACRQVTGNLRTKVDVSDLHWAAGGGLRYKTVIGTIRFDLGVRLNRLEPVEPNGVPNPDPGQRFAFHISVGEAF